MPELKVIFKDNQAGPRLRLSMKDESRRMRGALLQTAVESRDEILLEGRVDIASAGNFGSRWLKGLKGKIEKDGDDLTLSVTHDVSYFSVFQKGKVIHGKPLLWIPLSFAKDAIGKRARDFKGGLFRVDRKGGKAPLLLSIKTGEPKYFGKKSVRIPKKFHIVEICVEVARRMKSLYKKNFAKRGE